MLIIDDKMFLTRIISVLFIDGIYVLNVLDGKINLLKLSLSQNLIRPDISAREKTDQLGLYICFV